MALPEHPLMILSHTTKIFTTRQRRIRKMIASDCSSDQTDSPQMDEIQFQTHGFLNSIESCSQQSSPIDSMLGQDKKQESYELDIHNVYSMDVQIYETTILKIQKNEIQISLDHLIYDFKDFDIQKTIENYQKLSNTKFHQKYISLKTLAAQKPIYQSVVISQMNNQEEIVLEHRFNRKQEQQKNMKNQGKFQFRHFNEMHYHNGRQMRSHERILEEYKLRRKQYYSPNPTNGKFNLDNENRRKKIRERANELLEKVKKEDYVTKEIQNDK